MTVVMVPAHRRHGRTCFVRALVALAFGLVPFAGPRTSAHAQATAYTPGVTLTLGPGITVSRFGYYCMQLVNCSAWTAQGFSLVGRTDASLAASDPYAYRGDGSRAGWIDLSRAYSFASARGGRIVAAMLRAMYYTDDLGATWHRARFESQQSALALVFDGPTDFGAAVGTSGALWTTEDRGATWRLRRDGGADNLLYLAVGPDHTIVAAGQQGSVFVTFDGGTSVRVLRERGPVIPTIGLHQNAVWIQLEEGIWYRAAGGSIERFDQGPWGSRQGGR